jgi:hypothetical protein
MKHSWFKTTASFIIFAAISGLSALADATTALFLSREELTRISDLVVRVKVEKATYGESEDKRALVTRTALKVTQFLKGTGNAHLVVQQLGGKYNGKTQKVLGDAQLVPGEDAVIFLKRGDKGQIYFSMLSQSVYHVDDKGIARRNLEGLTLLQRSGDTMQPIKIVEPSETVESLMTNIKRLAGGH